MSSSSSPITFSGTSTFSADFQHVITRAVAIASLPIAGLQNNVSTLNGKQSALAGLNSSFLALQTALVALGSATQGSPAAQVSDATSLTATASTGALNGTYTVQVDDIGAATTTLSKVGLTPVTDPTSGNISPAASFTLTINGIPKTIIPAASSLASLVTAINNAADGVQATVVNVGSNASPDYRLSITSSNLASDTIGLDGGAGELLDTLATGTNALYKINGGVTDVPSTSRDLTLSTGLNVHLLHNSASPVTITVSNNYGAIQSSLKNIASAYNAAFDALGQHRGQSGGALSGDSLVFSLGDVLRHISQFTGQGSVGSLTALGLTVGQDGHLTFDSTAFSSLAPASVQAFLGDIGTSGFLKTANDAVSTVTDATTGLIPTDVLSIQSQITALDSKIVSQQARVSLLQTNLQSQLSQADAVIATLQSQKTYFAELFTATYGNGTSGR